MPKSTSQTVPNAQTIHSQHLHPQQALEQCFWRLARLGKRLDQKTQPHPDVAALALLADGPWLVLRQLTKSGQASTAQLATACGLSHGRCYRYLRQLEHQSWVGRQGNGRQLCWQTSAWGLHHLSQAERHFHQFSQQALDRLGLADLDLLSELLTALEQLLELPTANQEQTSE